MTRLEGGLECICLCW